MASETGSRAPREAVLNVVGNMGRDRKIIADGIRDQAREAQLAMHVATEPMRQMGMFPHSRGLVRNAPRTGGPKYEAIDLTGAIVYDPNSDIRTHSSVPSRLNQGNAPFVNQDGTLDIYQIELYKPEGDQHSAYFPVLDTKRPATALEYLFYGEMTVAFLADWLSKEVNPPASQTTFPER